MSTVRKEFRGGPQLFTCSPVYLFICSPVYLFTCSPTSVLDQCGGRGGSRSYTPLAGIPGVGFSARGRATGVSSHPFSYEEWAFTAMAGGCFQPPPVNQRVLRNERPCRIGPRTSVVRAKLLLALTALPAVFISVPPRHPGPGLQRGPAGRCLAGRAEPQYLRKRGFGAAGLNLAQGVPSGRYAVRPRLRARGFSADTGMTGWVFAKRAPPRTYGRWRTIPRTSGLTRLRGGRLGSRVRGFSRPRPRRHRRRHRRDHSSLPVVCPQTVPTSP